jgi:hypothetical protein
MKESKENNQPKDTTHTEGISSLIDLAELHGKLVTIVVGVEDVGFLKADD